MKEWISVLNSITAFAQYFVPGYIFLSCFNFSSATKNRDGIELLLLKSVTFSYIIFTTCYYLANCTFSFFKWVRNCFINTAFYCFGIIIWSIKKNKTCP